MSLLPIIQDDEATDEQAVIFDHSKQMFGRVANAVRVGSASPKIMQSLFSFIVGGMREEISNVLDKRTKCLVICSRSPGLINWQFGCVVEQSLCTSCVLSDPQKTWNGQ